MQQPRSEPPNPLHFRPRRRSLNGTWDFAIDDEAPIRGTSRECRSGAENDTWFSPDYSKTIQVPFCPQSTLSGVKFTGHHPTLWYRRSFEISEGEEAGRTLLHFGAVDFSCEVRVNDRFIGSHRGGYTPFHFDISHLVRPGNNTVEVCVVDHLDKDQPRGKQSWQAPFSCWYRECSGIWQSVWLEFSPLQGIARVDAEAFLGNANAPEEHRRPGRITLRIRPFGTSPATISVRLTHNDSQITETTAPARYPVTDIDIDLDSVKPWSPDFPNLYDIEVRMTSSHGVDRVDTYVGFRTVAIADGALTINDVPVYQRLVLDQGFWDGGYYTAPTDDDYRRDIEISKAMGFNGCRKHTKIEDPRFYYWADRLGYLVWEELPSPYTFSLQSQEQIIRDTIEMVRRDRGHPSVVTWTLYNESWGVPDIAHSREQQEFVRTLVELVRQLDPTRPVVANDGWELVGGDVYGIHSYAAHSDALERDIDGAFPLHGRDDPHILDRDARIESSGKPVWAVKGLPTDRIYMVTEFGGIGLQKDSRDDAWGYDKMARSSEELLRRVDSLVRQLRMNPQIRGFVYTQLTDVEQEVNGLLESNRTPKAPLEEIYRIITGVTNE